MMSPVPFTTVDGPSKLRDDSAGKMCATGAEVKLARHAKKGGLSLIAEAKMVSYKQFECIRSAFPGFKNLLTDVEGPDRG